MGIMLYDPFAQQVSIDVLRKRQVRQRNARLEAGFDQHASGLRIIATLAIAIDACDWQKSKTGLSWHRCFLLIVVDTSLTIFVSGR